MKLSIVFVNFNYGPLIKACIESILRQELAFRYEIIVVDNASEDESVALLRSDFPEITVVANEENVGLAAGVNIGLKSATGTYQLILNPDMIVLPGAIEKMANFMDEHADVGVLGGKLLSPNGELQYSCFRFYRPMTIIYRRTILGRSRRGRAEVDRFLMTDFDHASVLDVDWLMGACLMVRAAALSSVGGMDERFFLYFEDVDWCRRFWEEGWRVTYFPPAQFSHYYQRSSDSGGLLGLMTNRITREHIVSAAKYFWKYRGKRLPGAAPS